MLCQVVGYQTDLTKHYSKAKHLPPWQMPSPELVLVGNDEFVTLTVDIDDFHLVVILQVLAQLGDVNVHGTRVEIVVINPNGAQGIITLQYFVRMCAQQSQSSFSLVVNFVCFSPITKSCFWVSNI